MMRSPLGFFRSLMVLVPLALAGCGGGDSATTATSSTGGSSNNGTPSTVLSGTAAAGAPIVGQVTVKGALGKTKSALIEASGNYRVDVTGLTAPYRLRAEGTVGGRTYKLHSYAESADLGGTVNITPFTDLIVANAAGQVAESFFNSDTSTRLDPTELADQEQALKKKLKAVFDALGVDSAINLLNTTFSADHSQLDAVLDVVRVEVDSTRNIATIRNLIDKTSFDDDVTDSTDAGALQVLDAAGLKGTVTETRSIADEFIRISQAFADGLPRADSLRGFFTDDFLDTDSNLNQFLTGLTTDPDNVGLSFTNVSVSDLTADTATVTFYVVFQGVVFAQPEIWKLRKVAGRWKMAGNQLPVDAYFDYHCNDNGNNGGGACGINTDANDNDFTNNGTLNDAEIQSATVTLIDGTDGTAKAVIYLGTPDNQNGGSGGDLEVFTPHNNIVGRRGFTFDYQAFGNRFGELDPTLFVAGDTLRFDLYTEPLDITDASAPAIAANATPVKSFTRPLPFAPSLKGLYPTATDATKAAISNFTIGSDLELAWTLEPGTRNDEVLVEISDDNFNRVEVFVSTVGRTRNTITVASSELSVSGLDPNSANYHLLVRIYAADKLTGQYHSRDYNATIPAPAASTTGGGSTADGGSTGSPTPAPAAGTVCMSESGYDDTADGGLGAPVTPYGFSTFEAQVADCGGALPLTRADIVGKSVRNGTETSRFDDTGKAATAADPESGLYTDTSTGEQATFEWYLETVNGVDYLVQTVDSTLVSGLPAGFSARDTIAIIATTGAGFVSGSTVTALHYTEQSNYGDMVRGSGADGEIWNEQAGVQ